ncbi:hypothetical protein [Streptomyces sp. NPDC002889]|uniref:hypothetical protein n=1 Tax=Streptomyces sp. NPDC002889 TaxID=3364669 RepID=UPI003676D4B5
MADGADGGLLATASEAIALIRKAKSQAHVSMRADVDTAVVSGTREALDRFALVDADVRAAGRIGAVEQQVHDGALAVHVRF